MLALSNALTVFVMIASMGVALLVSSVIGAMLADWMELRAEAAHTRVTQSTWRR
jgi:hypothetical protein